MADTGTKKQKINDLEGKQEDRQAQRQNAERSQQGNLNQGISTGTTDTVRHGVDWGTADQGGAGQSTQKSKGNKTASDTKDKKKNKTNDKQSGTDIDADLDKDTDEDDL